jgi:hypothetical protein
MDHARRARNVRDCIAFVVSCGAVIYFGVNENWSAVSGFVLSMFWILIAIDRGGS